MVISSGRQSATLPTHSTVRLCQNQALIVTTIDSNDRDHHDYRVTPESGGLKDLKVRLPETAFSFCIIHDGLTVRHCVIITCGLPCILTGFTVAYS